MTSEMFIDWLHKLDKKITKLKKSIVFNDSWHCPAHPLQSIKLAFLPPNTRSVTQPMDQVVIWNLKLHYRKLVIKKKIRAVDNKTDFTISVLDALRMLSQAWGSVTSKTISNCFRHAKFVNPASHQVQWWRPRRRYSAFYRHDFFPF